mmetsp:Transcript_66722/g.169098  ORF Transcript_66722/g.169098 Transcript_66722/m.169098 type:complete len:283 (+) Transcript_66722:334-1182(+)
MLEIAGVGLGRRRCGFARPSCCLECSCLFACSCRRCRCRIRSVGTGGGFVPRRFARRAAYGLRSVVVWVGRQPEVRSCVCNVPTHANASAARTERPHLRRDVEGLRIRRRSRPSAQSLSRVGLEGAAPAGGAHRAYHRPHKPETNHVGSVPEVQRGRTLGRPLGSPCLQPPCVCMWSRRAGGRGEVASAQDAGCRVGADQQDAGRSRAGLWWSRRPPRSGARRRTLERPSGGVHPPAVARLAPRAGGPRRRRVARGGLQRAAQRLLCSGSGRSHRAAARHGG